MFLKIAYPFPLSLQIVIISWEFQECIFPLLLFIYIISSIASASRSSLNCIFCIHHFIIPPFLFVNLTLSTESLGVFVSFHGIFFSLISFPFTTLFTLPLPKTLLMWFTLSPLTSHLFYMYTEANSKWMDDPLAK